MSCCPGPTIVKYNINCGPASSGETGTYTFSNINVTGVGVFDNLTGTAVAFRGIASSGATVTVTNDDPNNTVNLEVNTAAVVAAIPDATTAVKGKAELSTDAEAVAKASTTVVLTPSNLAALNASTTFSGFARLATNAETQVGTSTLLSVTPAGLKSVTDDLRVNTTFANFTERGASEPIFIGQIGVQQDTLIPWVASGTSAGNFDSPIMVFGVSNTVSADTTIDLQDGDVIIADSQGNGNSLTFFDDGTLDFTPSGRLKVAGTLVPANSVVITSSTAGQVSSKEIIGFLSDENQSDPYTITNGSTLRTLDVTEGEFTASVAYTQAEIQTLSDTVTKQAKVLNTLINDLANLLTPTLGV